MSNSIDLEKMTLEELRALADEEGVALDGRWRKQRVVDELAEHFAAAVEEPEPESAPEEPESVEPEPEPEPEADEPESDVDEKNIEVHSTPEAETIGEAIKEGLDEVAKITEALDRSDTPPTPPALSEPSPAPGPFPNDWEPYRGTRIGIDGKRHPI